MSIMKEYSCIFVFDEEMNNVVLVRKLKGPTPSNPNGQKGLLNGLGGGLEEVDAGSIVKCAKREFLEESGISLDEKQEHLVLFRNELFLKSEGKTTVFYFYVRSEQLFNELKGNIGTVDNSGSYEFLSIESILNEKSEECVWNVPVLVLSAKMIYSIVREETDNKQIVTMMNDSCKEKTITCFMKDTGQLHIGIDIIEEETYNDLIKNREGWLGPIRAMFNQYMKPKITFVMPEEIPHFQKSLINEKPVS